MDCTKCEHYIEWGFPMDDCFYNCESCQLQGQSHQINTSKCPLQLTNKDKGE
jgi:hypothetical protein